MLLYLLKKYHRGVQNNSIHIIDNKMVLKRLYLSIEREPTSYRYKSTEPYGDFTRTYTNCLQVMCKESI